MLDANNAAELPPHLPFTDDNWARADWQAMITAAISESNHPDKGPDGVASIT
jgi:hypothetical protein